MKELMRLIGDGPATILLTILLLLTIGLVAFTDVFDYSFFIK